MSALPPEINRMTSEEKLELVRQVLRSIPDEDMPLDDEQMEDLELRIAEDRLNPKEGRPWDEIKAELLGRK
jgi:putative addiction module component (TIGR02574 family)